jgi:hypothetical protein
MKRIKQNSMYNTCRNKNEEQGEEKLVKLCSFAIEKGGVMGNPDHVIEPRINCTCSFPSPDTHD